VLALYMDAERPAQVSPALRKQMQGLSCFNFKTMPDAELLEELVHLTAARFVRFQGKAWI
jgi:hypothetical protein